MKNLELDYLTTSSPLSEIKDEDRKALSDDTWHDELVDDMAARSADASFTVSDLAKAMEADSFVRDFITSEDISRRSRQDMHLERTRQREALVQETLDTQWEQIGVKVTAPSEEEVRIDE